MNGDGICKDMRKLLPVHIQAIHYKESALHLCNAVHILNVIKLDFNCVAFDGNNSTKGTIDKPT